MDWFEQLTGLEETSYDAVRDALSVVDGRLVCAGKDTRRSVGVLTLPSLADLRRQANRVRVGGRLRLSIAEGDVRAMHRDPDNAGALFQVASQFNMLEMISPSVTPEHGVGRYEFDPTQGPACAIAAGAATVYRNYLVPLGDGKGQSAARQLDGSADFGREIARRMDRDVADLWSMRNGYLLPTPHGLEAIGAFLESGRGRLWDELQGFLRFGLHSDVEVTDAPSPGPFVSQVFCSALPVSYSGIRSPAWAPFATLVLEAAYEATLLAGMLNAARGASKKVFLTRLGGGAFGNDGAWIDEAMGEKLDLMSDQDLDVAIVSYGPPPPALVRLAETRGKVFRHRSA